LSHADRVVSSLEDLDLASLVTLFRG